MSLELNLSLFVPATNPATRLFEALARQLRERTDGALTLNLHANEALGSTADQYDLARTGRADLAYFMHGATPGRFPLTELAALPFVTPDARRGTEALLSAMEQYLAPEHPGVKLLFVAANAPMAVHSTSPLLRVDDLKGRRVRSAGAVVAATLVALGALPANIMPLDVPAALADGRIDAAAMTYEGAMINRLAGVVSHSLELDANTVTFGLAMNEQRYAELSAEHKSTLDAVLGRAAGLQLADKLAEAVDEGRRYMRAGGVTTVTLSRDERSRVATLLETVTAMTVGALAAKGLPAAAVHAALRQA